MAVDGKARAGQRGGAQLALVEVVLVLAILVRNFRFGLADPRPVMPAAIVSMQPNYPA